MRRGEWMKKGFVAGGELVRRLKMETAEVWEIAPKKTADRATRDCYLCIEIDPSMLKHSIEVKRDGRVVRINFRMIPALTE